MKPFKVLLVVRHPVGGIRTFLRYYYRYLNPKKYQFVLLMEDSCEADAVCADLAQPNVTFVRVGGNVGLKALVLKVREVLHADRYDLVHAHGLTSGIASILGARLTRTFLLVTLHDVFTANQFRGVRGIFKKWALSAGIALFNCIHCVSHDAKDNLLVYMPLLRLLGSRKIRVVLNGVMAAQFTEARPRDLRQEFGLPGDSFLIGFLGRFMNQKGFAELVSAYEQIQRAGGLAVKPLVLCFSAEDGFIREERTNVRERGLADKILFLPFVPDIGPTICGLDVVVMPSRWEACGLLAMEVLIAGVPLIGSDCIGLREVLRCTPARTFPARDSQALAAALCAEMLDSTKEQARAYAAEAARRFDVRDRVIEMERMLDSCIAHRTPVKHDA